MSKTTAIAVAVLSLAMYAMAQKGVGPPAGRGTGPTSGMPSQSMNGQQQNQSMQSQENPSAPSTSPAGISKAQSKVKTSPTPRGHHYGWQKGRHNPHQSASASAAPSASASAKVAASPSATASPKITAPPTQSP